MAIADNHHPSMISMVGMGELDEDALETLYCWVDEIPLSRRKKNMTRDFSDGVLVAELVKFFRPRIVELHNYVTGSSVENKMTNWHTLNRKVFPRLDFDISPDVIRAIAQCKPWVIEHVLLVLREKINQGLARPHVQNQPVGTGWKQPINRSDQPEVDQNTHKGYGHATYNLQQHRNTKNLQNKKDLSPRAPHPNQRLIQGPPDYIRHGEVVAKKMVIDKETTIRDRQVTIELLEAKVQRLENLLHLKDIRIEDLTSRVENLENKLNTSLPRKPAATRTKRAAFGHSKT